LILPLVLPTPLVVQAVFFIALLTAASVIDVRKRIIPDSICALVALAGLIHFSPAMLFGPIAALPLLIAAVCKQDSIGGGDIKLTAACGLVLGLSGGIAGMIAGLAAMLLFYAGTAVIRRIRKDRKKDKNTALPMAPFLSIGFITAYILNFMGF
jgi:leader peptidase (prepilin peptidase)/N-methyltransferase